MVQAHAPGKLILCGEHAVVYGQPAIAVPVFAVGATATVAPGTSGLTINLQDLGEQWRVDEHPDQPLAALATRTLQMLGGETMPLRIMLRSTIPIASGMGSGAALGAALVQALAAYSGRTLDAATVSALVYESERFYHGTPSGIDNSVVSFARPIWYQREAPAAPRIEPITLGTGLDLVIGDTGVRCPTRITVGGVRERERADPDTYRQWFEAIGHIVVDMRAALHGGELQVMGTLLDRNHALLQAIGVSSPELDRLVAAAHGAGALGAKLSGGGGGGVMFALARPEHRDAVQAALLDAGAARVIVTHVPASASEASLV